MAMVEGKSMAEALSEAFEAHEEDEVIIDEGVVEETPSDTDDSSTDDDTTGGEEEAAGPKAESDDEPSGDEVHGSVSDPDDNDASNADGNKVEDDTPAPQSWKAATREHWGSLPPEVKQEVARREKEINDFHNQTKETRKFGDEMREMLNPFEPLIASRGSDSKTAVKNLMTTAAGLTLGSAVQKAQIVSNIISEYGVDIGQLDEVLSGKDPSEIDPNSQLTQMIDQRMAPIQQFMQNINQQQASVVQQTQQSVQSEVESFGDTHEFFTDLREDMADLIDMSSKRGQTLSLEDAYKKAVALNSEIAQIVDSRKRASEVARKKEASSSLRPSTTVQTENTTDGTVRSDLLAAINGQ